MGISAYRLGVELRVSPPTVNDMVREKRGITREMAARLAISGLPSSSGSICRMLWRFIRSKRSFPRELRAIKPFAAAAAR